MKRLNRDGAPMLGRLPDAPRLDAAGLRAAVDAGAVVVDTRDKQAFKAGHLTGALAIADEATFSTRAGWFVDPERAVVLVASPRRIEGLVRALVRVGLDKVAGYVDPSDVAAMSALGSTPLASVDIAAARRRWENREAIVLDVRARTEYRDGHIPGALHIPASRLMAALDSVPRGKPLLVHCAGGGRSVAAASALLAKGFTDVTDVAGGFDEWAESGNPVETELTARAETA
jgi:hydroxyacylglutathione hydrolase